MTSTTVVLTGTPVPVTKSPSRGIPFSPSYKNWSPLGPPLKAGIVYNLSVPVPVIVWILPLDLLDILMSLAFVIVGLLKSIEVPSGIVTLEDSSNVEVAVIPITTTRSLIFWASILLLSVTISPTFIPVMLAGVITLDPLLAPVIVVVILSITSIGSQGANLATDIWSSFV